MSTRHRDKIETARALIEARSHLALEQRPLPDRKREEEGGCGVTGFASSVKVKGRHIFEPSKQMHNRGNGKGGGIAALGLDHDDLGVSSRILDEDYLIQIALINPECRKAVEERFLDPFFELDHTSALAPVDDYRDVEGLDVKPPDVVRYFGRVKESVLDRFIQEKELGHLERRRAEDEFVYQNSFRLNSEFYAGRDQNAFVLCHGRNLMVLKIVGYAERVVQYYQLENLRAHAWIAHQRYPTKGRVWHPGGAHPFIGLNEALVHNGDFANYYSVSEYLRQRGIFPLFMTDTEVSALLFDLLTRTYGYSLEHAIEALAPTTEMDFEQLPSAKKDAYGLLQACHVHGSPDGPWFFIIARNDIENGRLQLIGITDTAMLRPQVFALMDGEVKIGLVCSEKQAIDATLKSLADEDPRFGRVADVYWNARGGSHTDGGAFVFNIKPGKNGNPAELICTDKFGQPITVPDDQQPCPMPAPRPAPEVGVDRSDRFEELLGRADAAGLFKAVTDDLSEPGYDRFLWAADWLSEAAGRGDGDKAAVLEAMTLLLDRRYDTFDKRRRSLIEVLQGRIDALLAACPSIAGESSGRYVRIDFETRSSIRAPRDGEAILVIDAYGFEPEGDDCDARVQVEAHLLGWRRFICYGYRGQRFTGVGLGPETDGVRFDVYGSSGDYLASGIDGLEMYVHGNGQDQIGQIMKRGRLVVHGDLGQTFMYGAKGGEVYILGNAAGRPMINAVGRPRVVINGTCLDYLAESFMAGDPVNGGGFVIVNGMTYDWRGRFVDLPTPYPGSNLFSLASGGAIYIRDPWGKVVDEQLNGGVLDVPSPEDWALIRPYLEENERLFGISVQKDLLTVNGKEMPPEKVYRKVRAGKTAVLSAARAGRLNE
ncbi:MAG: glutamate synthase [Proteobacteria bacterium]|nr:glutamate synthase [Pseudomonadota bacterium]